MDLTAFADAAEEGAALELKDPAGNILLQGEEGDADRKPVTITLAGVESRRWRKAADAVANRRIKRKHDTIEEQRADVCQILAAVTLSWDGIVVEGAALECNAESARKLYDRFPWILRQVDEFTGERRNFMPASSGS